MHFLVLSLNVFSKQHRKTLFVRKKKKKTAKINTISYKNLRTRDNEKQINRESESKEEFKTYKREKFRWWEQ